MRNFTIAAINRLVLKCESSDGKMKWSEALLIIAFAVLLPFWDVYSDLLFMGNLFYMGHPKFASMMLCPILLSTLCLIPHWWRTEANWSHRLATFPYLILQLWPQYRMIRILILGLWKNDPQWRREKLDIEKNASSIGLLDIFSVVKSFLCFVKLKCLLQNLSSKQYLKF